MTDARFGQETGMIALEYVECNPSIHCTLFQCPHGQPHDGNCHGEFENVGVICEQKKIVKGVSATNVTTPNRSTPHTVTVLINVTLNDNNNSIMDLFQVGCYNQQHGVYSVSNETNNFITYLRDLLPSSFYTCCTSRVSYECNCQQYVARGTCISIKTQNNSTSNPVDPMISNQTESKALTSVGLVGGILGFIIAVLLIALVCLLQPHLKKFTITKRRYVTRSM